MSLSRRGILGSIICAPAIVRASSLMPVKAWKAYGPYTLWTTAGVFNCGTFNEERIVMDFLASSGKPDTWLSDFSRLTVWESQL